MAYLNMAKCVYYCGYLLSYFKYDLKGCDCALNYLSRSYLLYKEIYDIHTFVVQILGHDAKNITNLLNSIQIHNN